jgi:hypothetical protein
MKMPALVYAHSVPPPRDYSAAAGNLADPVRRPEYLIDLSARTDVKLDEAK